jgi:predicted RND superfamily exporter protein
VINYGVMGLTGMPLNTPNSISAALAIGIGADYAIYLLYRIREELGWIQEPSEAIRSALRSAGKAVQYVGSAVAGGYAVLMLSIGFNIHIWFGSLIALSMVVSVISALFLIPSLLMTFLPRFLLAATGGRGLKGKPDRIAAL